MRQGTGLGRGQRSDQEGQIGLGGGEVLPFWFILPVFSWPVGHADSTIAKKRSSMALS